MKKEDIELAEEHIKLAEELVEDSARDLEDKGSKKKLTDVAFELEKAEAELEDFDEA